MQDGTAKAQIISGANGCVDGEVCHHSANDQVVVEPGQGSLHASFLEVVVDFSADDGSQNLSGGEEKRDDADHQEHDACDSNQDMGSDFFHYGSSISFRPNGVLITRRRGWPGAAAG